MAGGRIKGPGMRQGCSNLRNQGNTRALAESFENPELVNERKRQFEYLLPRF